MLFRASAGLSGGLLRVALNALMRGCEWGAAGLAGRLPGAGAVIAVDMNGILISACWVERCSGILVRTGLPWRFPVMYLLCEWPRPFMCVGLPCDSTSPPIVGCACGLICDMRICSCLGDCGR